MAPGGAGDCQRLPEDPLPGERNEGSEVDCVREMGRCRARGGRVKRGWWLREGSHERLGALLSLQLMEMHAFSLSPSTLPLSPHPSFLLTLPPTPPGHHRRHRAQGQPRHPADCRHCQRQRKVPAHAEGHGEGERLPELSLYPDAMDLRVCLFVVVFTRCLISPVTFPFLLPPISPPSHLSSLPSLLPRLPPFCRR